MWIDNLLYYSDVICTLANTPHQVFGAVVGEQFRQILHPIVALSRLSFTVRLMRRSRSTGTLFNPLAEAERYIHFLRRIRKTMVENCNQRPLKEFAQPSDEEPSSSIVNPSLVANLIQP